MNPSLASSLSSNDSFKGQATSGDGGQADEGGAGSLLTKEANTLDALFGALYTVSKEKYTENYKMSIANIILDWIQLMTFVISANYAWNIQFNSVFLRWTTRVNFSIWLKAAGYPAFSALFYMLVIALSASVALCAYVAHNFKTNSFPFVWPIKLLRFFVSIFLETFYISLLNVFLAGPDCNLASGYYHGGNNFPRGFSDQFPGKKCFAVPHVFMFVIGSLFTVVAILTNYLMVIGSSDLDLWSSNLQSSLHSSTEVRFWVCRTSITVASVLLSNHPNFQGIWLFLNSAFMVYSLLRKAPYLNPYINCFRMALYTVFCWCSLCLLLLLQKPKSSGAAITLLMAVGVGFAFALGWFLMHFRIAVAQRSAWKKFSAAAPNFDQVKHRFFDDYEVEIAARCHRIKTQAGQPSAEWVDIGEAIFRHGLRQFPKSSFLNLAYSNFLFSVRSNVKAGSVQLSMARKTKLSLGEKFVIFCRDRERKQRAGADAGGEGNGAMDLVSYVELQANMKAILTSHLSALKAIRNFWRELLKKEVTFNHLSRAFDLMESSERTAEKGYRLLLERYPKNSKLLRTYGKFLEDVQSNPWAASKYFTESERLEDIQADQARDALLTGGAAMSFGNDGGLDTKYVDDASHAVVVINESGVIQFVNRQLLKIFGYRKGELEGKNVSCLMPNPFAAHHTMYLRNYKITGKSRIMGESREVLGLHKNRYTFNIKINVTRLQQSEGEGLNFMGVISKVDDDSTQPVCCMTTGGLIISSNRAFTDITGYKSTELLGKNFRTLLVNQEEAEAILKNIAELSETTEIQDFMLSGGGRSLASYELRTRHKFGSAPLALSMAISIGGSDATKIVVCKFALTEKGQGFLAVNDLGLIQYCSSSLELLLGFVPGVLSTGSGISLGKLLPMPVALLHHSFIETLVKTYAQTGSMDHFRPISCGSGRLVCLHHKNGSLVPVTMRLGMMREDDKPLFTASIEKAELSSPWTEHVVRAEDAALEGARLRLIVNRQGTVLCSDAPTSYDGPRPAHFGYLRSDLEGISIVDMIDLFAEGLQSSLLLQPNATPETVCPALLRKVADQMESSNVIVSYRVGVALARQGEGFAPAFLTLSTHSLQDIVVDRLIDAGIYSGDPAWLTSQLRQESYVMDLFVADNLLGTVDLDKSGRIRRCDRAASIIFGHSPDSLSQGNLALPELFSTPIPPNRIPASLGLKLGKSIGTRTTLDVLTPDESVFPVTVLFAARNEGNRLHGLIYCPSEPPSLAPIGSYRRCQTLLYKFASNAPGFNPAPMAPAAASLDSARGVRFTDLGGEAPDGRSNSTFGGALGAIKAVGAFKGLRGGKRNVRASAGDDATGMDGIGTMGWSASEMIGPNESAGMHRPRSPSMNGQGPPLVPGSHASFTMGRAAPGPNRRASFTPGLDSIAMQAAAREHRDSTANPGVPATAAAEGRLSRMGAGTGAGRRSSAQDPSTDDVDQDAFYTVDELQRFHGPEEEVPENDDDDAMSVDSDRGHIEVEAPDQRDFRRAKRMKRLKRMLTSSQAQGTIGRLKMVTFLSCAVILLAHIIIFAVGMSAVERHKQRIRSGLSVIGDLQSALQRSIFHSLEVSDPAAAGQPYNSTVALMALQDAEDFSRYFETLVKSSTSDGFAQSAARLTDDISPADTFFPPDFSPHTSLYTSFFNTWSLQREFMRHSKIVNLAPAQPLFYTNASYGYDYNASVIWLQDVATITLYAKLNDAFLDSAAPVCIRSLRQVVQTELISVTIQGVLIVPVCAAMLYVCIKMVMATRYSFFSLFVLLPRPMILNLATKDIRLDDDDSDDEVEDDLDFDRQRMKEKTMDLEDKSRGMKIQIDPKLAKKKLKATQSYSMIAKILGPFSVFVGLLIIYMGTVSATLFAEVEPLTAMVASEMLYTQASRLRLLTYAYVNGRTAPGDLGAAARIRTSLDDFLYAYQDLLVGKNGVERKTLQKPEFKAILFSNECLRKRSPCLPEGDALYEVTHEGLGAMVNAYALAVRRLLDTPPAELSPSLSDFRLVDELGENDLRDGLTTFKGIFLANTFKGLESIEIMMIVLLVVLIVVLVVGVLVLRPFLLTIAAEANRVAELLSHVPEDLNVEQLVDALTGEREDGEDSGRGARGNGPQLETWDKSSRPSGGGVLARLKGGNKVHASDGGNEGGNSQGAPLNANAMLQTLAAMMMGQMQQMQRVGSPPRGYR